MTDSPAGPSTCAGCGGTEFEEGFIDDMSVGNGRVRWVAGVFRQGLWGGAKGRGVGKGLPVLGFRCTACSHLAIYISTFNDADPYGI